MFSLWLGILGCLLLYILVDRIIVYHRLSHIPGPIFAPLSRLPLFLISAGGSLSHDCLDLTRKYGPLCRIGPNHVLTSSPDLLRRMNAPRSPYRRSAWYGAVRAKPRIDTMLSTRSEAKHSELRRKMKAGYDGKENERLEPEIDAGIAAFVDLIEREYVYTTENGKTKGKPMDLALTALYWSNDAMGRIAFGKELGDCRDNKDNFDFIKAVRQGMPIIVGLASVPEVHGWLERWRIVDLLAPSTKDKRGFGKIAGMVEEKVAERYGPDAKDVRDMLGSFVRHGLGQQEANSEAILLAIAGSDTTAMALRSILLHLISSPPALRKLHTEIDNAISKGHLSSPAQEAETRKLPYLQACIREGLRIWPPAAALAEKEVPPEGDTIDGIFLPGGTLISQSIFALCRDPAVFGDDAEMYCPERWIEAQGEELRRMNESVDLIFGSGRFECVGKRVALIQVQKVLVELLRRYDFALVYPDRPWESKNYGVFSQENMWTRVTHRV